MNSRKPSANGVLRMTRRTLLGSMSSLALTTALAGGCSKDAGEGRRPWSDDTFFSDGTGWAG